MLRTDPPAIYTGRQTNLRQATSETALRLSYRRIDEWPPLAWLAILPDGGAGAIEVFHGPWVETLPEGFCEAVWPGDFEALDFDRTEIVAGTGMRLRDEQAAFVSSASTVDKLQTMAVDGRTLVSNSLACLLAGAEAEVDPTYRDYFRFFFSVVEGLDECERLIESSKGTITLTYFNNLRWDGRALQEIPKPSFPVDLKTFSDYKNFLDEAFSGIARNMASPGRRRRYTFLGTQSSGYDSTTVTSLARNHGLRQVLCFETTVAGRNDSGVAIARSLGIEPIVVDPNAWQFMPFAEVPFLAGNSFGEEVHFKAVEDQLRGRVLLTGYHGDKIWALAAKRPSDRIVRGDPSGSSLTEYRLWAGFIHCPVPFWLARRHPEIAQISRNPEMAPWDLRVEYNRPLCRRIAEEAGVPRQAFGMTKSAASRWPHHNVRFGTPEGFDAFCRWLRGRRRQWITRRRVPPVAHPLLDRAGTKILELLERSLMWIGKNVPLAHRSKLLRRLSRLRWAIDGKYPWVPGMRRYVFPWALAEAVKRYRGPQFKPAETGRQP